MNYRHAFHAGNHADVLKHVVLLALLDALLRKDTPCFVLDTHAGRGRYLLQDGDASRTGEAAAGILRLTGLADPPPALARYLAAAAAELPHYPGSPLPPPARCADTTGWPPVNCRRRKRRRSGRCSPATRVWRCMRATAMAQSAPCYRRGVDGTRYARGLVLVDPPYEAQEAEYPLVVEAMREALQRWPQATCAIWYPIKRRRSLQPFLRGLEQLPVRTLLLAELLIRADDSPLRLNGSGMAVLNPPWKLEEALAPVLPVLQARLGEAGASTRLEWLKRDPG